MTDAGDVWSGVADAWAAHWGGAPHELRRTLVRELGVDPDRPGATVLDVGCGSGELLALLAELGAVPSGIDPAPRMVELARAAAPDADVRLGAVEALPWGDDAFSAVVSVNALQFAADPVEALIECARVTTPGGAIGIACWAESAQNDLDTLERVVAEWHDDEPSPDPPYRVEGGLEAWLVAAGLEPSASGIVDVPFAAADDDALLQGVLFGEDASVVADAAPVVLEAARPFRQPDGGYLLRNRFRYAVARLPLLS